MRRDVVITGMGILSCAGANLKEARSEFIHGHCHLTPIADAQARGLRAKYAGQVSHLFGAEELSPELKAHDRHVHLALMAAREALAAAGIVPQKLGRRMGLIFSTCSGPMLLIEAHYERILRGEPQLTAAELFAKRYYSGAQVLARDLGIGGICTTVVTACSASTAAIALAADLIRCGMLDSALAGGADAFSVSTLAGFDGLKATSESRCAPFSKPFGLNLGEAAAFVVLESAVGARQRGARPQATLLGSGMSNDAHHCSAPEPGGRGLAEAMRRGLADAGLVPEQISYLNAHGTGTEANDKAECRAIRKVFGERTATIPISSTKSMVGHCLGAAGAVELIASVVCAEAGVLPPTANFTEARDGCAVDCVPDAGRAWGSPHVFLSNNSAFGGHNTSLAVTVPDSEMPNAISSPLDDQNSEPIYITACGIVSTAGAGWAALNDARQTGRSGLHLVTPSGLPPLLAGIIDERSVEAADRRLNLRSMDRSSKWATVAARLAIAQAGFPEKPATLAELGLFLNLAAGPSWAESDFLTSFLGNDRQVAQLGAFPYIVPGSVAGNVCRALMLAGHNLTLSTGPAAGLFGLEPAMAALRCGHAGALLCGAVDELTDRILADSYRAGLISEDSPPGEGAAVYMLESSARARARGAKPLAELCSVASAVIQISPAATLAEVIKAVLEQGQAGAEDIRAVCLTGNPALLPHADWRERLVRCDSLTGRLAGAQPLLDLAVAMGSPDLQGGGLILSLAVTDLMACAVLVRCETNFRG